MQKRKAALEEKRLKDEIAKLQSETKRDFAYTLKKLKKGAAEGTIATGKGIAKGAKKTKEKYDKFRKSAVGQWLKKKTVFGEVL